MSNFTVQTIRAAALLLFAAVCTAVQADGPKRIVSVQKAKKHVVLKNANSTVTPTPLKTRPNKASTAQRDILVDEDFSGITWGSEEQPDTTSYLASSYYEPGIYIDPSLTKDGTWAGEFAHAAGGMVYLKTPNSMYSAALMTPLGDYSGELTVTLKAKAMPHWQVYGEDPDTGEELWYKSTGSSIGVEVCKGGYLDYEIADTDLEDGTGYYSTRLYEGQGWTEVELHFNNYSADNDGFVCFYTEGAILIDDIKITSAPTFLATPKMIGVTDFQADRFTIAWQPLRKALDYSVDLYKKVYTSDADGAFAEDFENFTAPQEGWTTTSTETAAGAGPDGSTALVLRGGDTLTTPENGATYKSMDFYLKFVTHYEDPSYSWGLVYIDGLTLENFLDYYGEYAYRLTVGTHVVSIAANAQYDASNASITFNNQTIQNGGTITVADFSDYDAKLGFYGSYYIDKDDVAQGVLGEVGEAHGVHAVLLLQPLVGSGVAQLLISLRATMIAMTTIRITRTIRR